MKLTYLPLTCANYQQSYLIHSAGHLKPWSEKVFSDCLSEPYFAYQVLHAEHGAGYYIAMQVLDEVTLMDIAVDKYQRGRGLGKKLLMHFIQQSQEQGMLTAWLEVRASNQAAIHLYTSLGFTLVEQRKNYYPTPDGREDALIMKCIISNALNTLSY